MKKIAFILILFSSTMLNLYGQKENKFIRSGNRAYEDGNYETAEVDYLKSIQTKKSSHRGLYNLGDALYQQDNYFDASSVFDSVSKMNIDKKTVSHAHYNLGNSLLKLSKDSAEVSSQALQASIEAYKNSLRKNPDDMDAKYNLAYAQKMLKDQQQQQQKQNQDQKQDQKQDQNQDQKQDQQKQDQQEQNKQDQEREKQEKQQQQQQQISKEDAERMLQALKNEEKKTMEKLQKQKVKMAKRVKSEKDW